MHVLFSSNTKYLFGDRAVQIIEEEASNMKPFFLYLAQQNVHLPLEVSVWYDQNQDLLTKIQTLSHTQNNEAYEGHMKEP